MAISWRSARSLTAWALDSIVRTVAGSSLSMRSSSSPATKRSRASGPASYAVNRDRRSGPARLTRRIASALVSLRVPESASAALRTGPPRCRKGPAMSRAQRGQHPCPRARSTGAGSVVAPAPPGRGCHGGAHVIKVGSQDSISPLERSRSDAIPSGHVTVPVCALPAHEGRRRAREQGGPLRRRGRHRWSDVGQVDEPAGRPGVVVLMRGRHRKASAQQLWLSRADARRVRWRGSAGYSVSALAATPGDWLSGLARPRAGHHPGPVRSAWPRGGRPDCQKGVSADLGGGKSSCGFGKDAGIERIGHVRVPVGLGEHHAEH